MLYGFIFIIAAIVLFLLVQYNGLVKLRQMVRNAWSDVDVYLKRRADLIPNIVQAVQAYASHEKALLEAVAEARTQAVQAPGPTEQRAQAESRLETNAHRLIALAEAYPDLKASANFTDLQRELTETERLIASARQYYNACVRDYNIKIDAFPSNLVAGTMGLRHAEFFQTDSLAEREAPRL
jgi:LemA protein